MIRVVGGVLRQTGNYMQDSTSWRGWRGEQKSSIGRLGTAKAYCRNVNPPNVLQLEEEQDHRLTHGLGHEGGGDTGEETQYKVRGEKADVMEDKRKGGNVLSVCVFKLPTTWHMNIGF